MTEDSEIQTPLLGIVLELPYFPVGLGDEKSQLYPLNPNTTLDAASGKMWVSSLLQS